MEKGCWPKEDPDHEYIEGRIRYSTRRLKDKCRFTKEECEDVAQDLRVHLLLRLSSFDPQRAKRRTFISRIIENHAHTITHARYAAKRNPHQVAYSLDAQIDANNPGSGMRRDYLTEDEYYESLRGSTPVEARRDLKISLSILIDQMPELLRQVCELLYAGYTLKDAARILNIHRSTAHDRKAQIRRRLRAAGFEKIS